MKPYKPVLFIKIDKDIADYLMGLTWKEPLVVFLIALDDVARIKVISKVAKHSGLNQANLM